MHVGGDDQGDNIHCPGNGGDVGCDQFLDSAVVLVAGGGDGNGKVVAVDGGDGHKQSETLEADSHLSVNA